MLTACETFLQERQMNPSSFQETLVTKEYEKRLWLDVLQESEEND